MTLIKNERNDFKMKFNLTIILIFMSFFGVFQSKAQVKNKAFGLLFGKIIQKFLSLSFLLVARLPSLL